MAFSFCVIDPDKVFFFVFSNDSAAVFDHHAKGCGIIPVDPQVDFFFGNDAPCDIQRKTQSFGCQPPASVSLANKIPDMARAFFERFVEIMPYSDLPGYCVIQSKKEYGFGNHPIRQMDSF